MSVPASECAECWWASAKSGSASDCQSRSSSRAPTGRHGLWRLLRRSLDAYVSDFLATTDGVQLAKAFLRIKSSGVRRRLVEALADDAVA